jgi:hypothetical protein
MLQASAVVHALPSSHGTVLLVWAQPVVALQVSFVHRFPSSHDGACPPTHAPLLQTSPSVQRFPSSHGLVLGVKTHPEDGSHASSVQGFSSAQWRDPSPLQRPSWQMSPVEQALPSLQGAVLLVWTHPVAGSHPSSVHGFASSQLGSIPGRHTP